MSVVWKNAIGDAWQRRDDGVRTSVLLSACQFLFLAATSIGLAFSGLVGLAIAPNVVLATVPFTATTIATALTTILASKLMARRGYRLGFVLGAGCGTAGGAICCVAVVQRQFWLFCLGSAFVGVFQAFAQYYRFAAADNSPRRSKGRAVSVVLSGGILAALLGPLVARETKELFPAALFAGSYLAVSVIALCTLLPLRLARFRAPSAAPVRGGRTSLTAILAQPPIRQGISCCVIGYAVMMFVMTSAPLAVVGSGLHADGAATVIQWHLMGMFAPSLFTGRLITKYGTQAVILAGTVLCLAAAVVALSGMAQRHFVLALVLNGVAWNFLYVGGTALLTQSYRDDDKVTVQTFNEFATFTVVASASGLSGLIYRAGGWAVVNLIAIGAIGLLLAFVWLNYRALRQARPLAEGV